MSQLLDLALEPFSDIIALLELDNILALWICGDKALQWRLSRGKAVRNLSVWPRQPSNAPWPPVIRYFEGLTIFLVIRSQLRLDPDVILNSMRTLNRKLTSLSLNLSHSISAFNALISADNGHFPYLTSLYLISPAELLPRLLFIPRTVTNLHLGHGSHFMGHLSLSDLPPGLTSLVCHVDSLDISAPSSSSFPIGLERLHLHILSYLPIFTLLPPCCISLKLFYKDNKTAKLTDADWMALSSLQLKTLDMATDVFISVERAQMLPRTLETISLRSCDLYPMARWTLPILKALPEKVLELEHVWPFEISASVAKVMPRTLKMGFSEEIEADAMAFLPPNTISVTLTETSNPDDIQAFPAFLKDLKLSSLSPSLASKLPHTLEDLTLNGEDAELTKEIVELLPRNLIILSVQSSISQVFDDMQSLKALPPTLNMLNLGPFGGDVDSFIPKLTPSESSQWLPSEIHTLELGCLDFSQSNMADWLLDLPSTIVSLTLLVSALPKGALSALTSNHVIQILDIAVMETPEDGWDPLIPFLPRALTYLRLVDHTRPHPDTNISNESFKMLPLTIDAIYIPNSPLLSAEGVSHLLNLRSLCLNHSTPKWFTKIATIPKPKI